MNPHYLYLAIDLSAIIIPLAFSFYPKANFSAKWKYLWPSLLVPALLFIVWDEWFTRMGVWGFNPAYLTGVFVFSLPIEEILFFICIPYACVFTYEAIHFLKPNPPLKKISKGITRVLIVMSVLLAVFFYQRWYTFATFLLNGVVLTYFYFKSHPEFLGRFYFTYLFILIPFFLVNGILTGTGIESQVVWYNDSDNLGIRMGTIPVEDIFYGMLLVLLNVSLFEYLQKRQHLG